MDYLRVGLITQTTARLFVRTSNTGTIVATVNGNDYTGDSVEPGTHDGTGAVDITGLSKGTVYEATVTDGTDSKTIKFKTAGEHSSGFFVSCNYILQRDFSLMKAFKLFPDADYLIWGGDTPYNVQGGTVWGITCVSIQNDYSTATDQANAYAHHRRMLEKPEMNCLNLGVSKSIIKIKDDHEYAGNFTNDWEFMRDSTVSWLSSQQDLDDLVATQQEAWASYAIGNRDHHSDGVDYFSWVVGNHKLIKLDCIKYKQAPSSGVFLGDTQLAWFLGELSNDDGVEIITVLSSKTTASGNGDGWWDYRQAGRDELGTVLDHIESNQVTCVAWLSGDKHHPFVQYSDNPQGIGTQTVASPHLCICGCPMSTGYQRPPAFPENEIVFKLFEDDNGRSFGHGVVAAWEASDGGIDYYIVHENQGIIWHGYQLVGSNVLRYETLKMAI